MASMGVGMKYREYLQTDEWQEKARVCKEFYNWRCALCYASAETLDAHHRTYERLGQELPTDLIALCRPCHAKFHDKPPEDLEVSRAEGVPVLSDPWVEERLLSVLKGLIRFVPNTGQWTVWGHSQEEVLDEQEA